MLERNPNHNSSPSSPFELKTLVTATAQPKSPPTNTHESPPENNRMRTLRRAGNICEISAGASINSAVIFSFHLLQVHPIGMFLALGVSHCYFTATAAGEAGRKITNIMSGCSASLALLCSLSESIAEWWEAHNSKSIAGAEIQQMYVHTTLDKSSWLDGLGNVLLLTLMGLILFNCFTKKRS